VHQYFCNVDISQRGGAKTYAALEFGALFLSHTHGARPCSHAMAATYAERSVTIFTAMLDNIGKPVNE
jgi:hypothetical protein